MRILSLPVVLLALSAALAPGAATADDWRREASPYDVERIDAAPKALALAVEAARERGTPADIKEVDALLGPARPVEGEALLGDWRCRTLKLGGNFGGLTIYGWFKCRISIAEGGLYFEKLSGSQRTSGYLRPVYPSNGEGLPERYIYLGAAHYGGDPKSKYGGPANRLRRVGENKDDPGILEALGRNWMRIGFPLPVFESEYDFLELKR